MNTKLSEKFPNLSRVGLGTVQFGMAYGFTKAFSQAQADEILNACQANSVNLLDTARDYGDSEKKIGDYLKRTKSTFYVATKFGRMTAREAADEKKMTAHLRGSVERSLMELGAKRISLLMLHQTDPFLVENPVFWKTLKQLKKEDRYEAFGLSVYEVKPTEKIVRKHKAQIDFIQAPYNLLDRRFELFGRSLQKNGVGFISRSAFLKGVLVADEKTIPAELKRLRPLKKKLDLLSEKSGLSNAHIALLFALQADFIDSTLVGVASSSELLENLKALTLRGRFLELKEQLNDLRVDDLALVDPRRWQSL